MRDLASLLGRGEDVTYYGKLATDLKQQFNAFFYDETEGGYYSTSREAGYRQSPQAVALAFGLVPEDHAPRVVNRLVEDIKTRNGHIWTGILGMEFIADALCENGRSDVAYSAHLKDDYPSLGNMIREGATTLWEDLTIKKARSLNHKMFATPLAWAEEWPVLRACGFALSRHAIRVRGTAVIELHRAERRRREVFAVVGGGVLFRADPPAQKVPGWRRIQQALGFRDGGLPEFPPRFLGWKTDAQFRVQGQIGANGWIVGPAFEELFEDASRFLQFAETVMTFAQGEKRGRVMLLRGNVPLGLDRQFKVPDGGAIISHLHPGKSAVVEGFHEEGKNFDGLGIGSHRFGQAACITQAASFFVKTVRLLNDLFKYLVGFCKVACEIRILEIAPEGSNSSFVTGWLQMTSPCSSKCLPSKGEQPTQTSSLAMSSRVGLLGTGRKIRRW